MRRGDSEERVRSNKRVVGFWLRRVGKDPTMAESKLSSVANFRDASQWIEANWLFARLTEVSRAKWVKSQ